MVRIMCTVSAVRPVQKQMVQLTHWWEKKNKAALPPLNSCWAKKWRRLKCPKNWAKYLYINPAGTMDPAAIKGVKLRFIVVTRTGKEDKSRIFIE